VNKNSLACIVKSETPYIDIPTIPCVTLHILCIFVDIGFLSFVYFLSVRYIGVCYLMLLNLLHYYKCHVCYYDVYESYVLLLQVNFLVEELFVMSFDHVTHCRDD